MCFARDPGVVLGLRIVVQHDPMLAAFAGFAAALASFADALLRGL